MCFSRKGWGTTGVEDMEFLNADQSFKMKAVVNLGLDVENLTATETSCCL